MSVPEWIAEKAEEIIKEFKNAPSLNFGGVHPNIKAYLLAEGYLLGLEAGRKEKAELEERLRKMDAVFHRYERA